MTGNQIAYWNYKESQRHNLAGENENSRHNLAQETETQRHDVAGEQETSYHNRFSENLALISFDESARHNLQQEAIGAKQASASATSASASLMNARTNASLLPYQIEKLMGDTGYVGAQTDYVEAQTDYTKTRTQGQEYQNRRDWYETVTWWDAYELERDVKKSQIEKNKADVANAGTKGFSNTVDAFDKLLGIGMTIGELFA
jgi:hypothetical protein